MKTNHVKLLGLAFGAILAMGASAGVSNVQSIEGNLPLTFARKEAGETFTATQSTFTATSADNLGGDTHISYSTSKGGGTSDPAINSGVIRLYQKSGGGDGGTITVTVQTGYKITAVEIGSGMSTTVRYYLDGESSSGQANISIAQNYTYTASGLSNESVTFVCNGTDKNSRLYVNHLAVTYVEDSALPSDVEVKEVKLAQGTGTDTVYQNEVIDPTGFEVSLVYGSDTDPSYSSEETIAVSDSRLTWNINTEELGQQELTVTFKDDDVSVTSNSLSIEVIADPFGDYIVDVLNIDNFPVEIASQYADGSYISSSGVAYKSNNAGSYNSIQLRSNNSNSGIVTTTTIGTVDLIEITFNTNSNSERVIDIYGSHEPFSSPADLYSGSAIGSIAYADGQIGTLAISELEGAPYEYIGIRSRSGAVYLNQIRIGYTEAAAPTDVEVVAKFVADYMHMTDYDADKTGVGTGACLGEGGYYQVAMTAFLELTPEQQELFKTGDEFADARKRYEAWAHFNGDDTPYDGSFNPSLAARIHNDDKAEYWIVVGISLATIGLAAGLFFLRKKKEA